MQYYGVLNLGRQRSIPATEAPTSVFHGPLLTLEDEACVYTDSVYHSPSREVFETLYLIVRISTIGHTNDFMTG
jgi:hypothetical protein